MRGYAVNLLILKIKNYFFIYSVCQKNENFVSIFQMRLKMICMIKMQIWQALFKLLSTLLITNFAMQF